MPLPQEILLSLQIGHAPQQTIFEGSVCKKRNGRQSVSHQRGSRQNHHEIPLHSCHEIASNTEVNGKYIKYRSNWNAHCWYNRIGNSFVHCVFCFLIVVTEFLTETPYGRHDLCGHLVPGYFLSWGGGGDWWHGGGTTLWGQRPGSRKYWQNPE